MLQNPHPLLLRQHFCGKGDLSPGKLSFSAVPCVSSVKEISPKSVLNRIANTLVLKVRFANQEDALRSLARAAVRDRMVHYRRRIQRLKRKHGADFADFTRQIEGNATLQQEDDWLA